MSKTLIAYFSATGTTAALAKKIATEENGDLFEIKPEEPYTQADLNWMDKKSRSTLEMKDEACRPAIAETLDNMEDYDTIYLGFPIWWYREPSIIDTFLEQYDFSGKAIILFATSGGSRFGKTVKHMKTLLPKDTLIKEGRLNG